MVIHTYHFDCRRGLPEKLDDAALADELLRRVAEVNDLNVVAAASHQFQPQGVSCALVLAESHIAIHTWPEEASAYVVLSSCKELTNLAIEATRDMIQQAYGFAEVTGKELR